MTILNKQFYICSCYTKINVKNYQANCSYPARGDFLILLIPGKQKKDRRIMSEKSDIIRLFL